MTVEMTPLPRGRHGLAPEEVEASQRVRILRAMAEIMAEKGYARTSVADILRRARVSRETFYELFGSKEECFMSAFEQAYSTILDSLTSSKFGDSPSDGGGQAPKFGLSRVLGDYLEALAADPVSARVFLLEVYAAGPAAIERRTELQRTLVDALVAALGLPKEERFTVEAVLAAIIQLVTTRLALGDAAGLRELHEPAMRLVGRLGLDAAA